MTVLLNQSYQGVPAGQTAEFPLSTEQALISQGIAVNSTGNPTSGNITCNAMRGSAAIQGGASTISITNAFVTANSFVIATVAQFTADATLTQIVRVLTSAGSFQIWGNANATATVRVDWVVINSYPPNTD